MISLLHLIWIIPISMILGMWLTALFYAGDQGDKKFEK